MGEGLNQQRMADEDQLRLLAIFHYVVGGLAAIFACIPIIHLVLGLFLVFAREKMGGQPPPVFMGWFFIVFATCFILAGWTLGILIVINGRFLARRTKYMFCFVVACVECLFTPFGTVLGVFTLVVLMRPT